MRNQILLSLTALGVTMLACSVFVGGPELPLTPTAVSPASSQDLQTQVEQALTNSAQTGVFTLTLDEGQLTAFLASALASQSTPLLSEPRVVLRDGSMIVFGKAQSGVLQANISITTQFSVDPDGQPRIEVTDADFGPLPAPEGLKDAVSAFLEETLTGSIGPIALGFRLESIAIADGIMTVSGRIK